MIPPDPVAPPRAQLKSIAGDGTDPRRFAWLDPPPADAVERALWRLKDAGALTSAEAFTPLGAALANLPVELPVGKLMARRF